jgi:hypothetical protein
MPRRRPSGCAAPSLVRKRQGGLGKRGLGLETANRTSAAEVEKRVKRASEESLPGEFFFSNFDGNLICESEI